MIGRTAMLSRPLRGSCDRTAVTYARARASWHDLLAMIRVLVVDDHPVLRAGLEAVLRAEPGFVCVGTAADGLQMMAALRRTRPDVVILDRRLGDEDGIALCAGLRSEPIVPEVVLYTANEDPGLDALARAAGAHAVVVKTADIGELFDALRLAARGRGAAA
jgi:DNA-binding NarL/FixJ family response regulator